MAHMSTIGLLASSTFIELLIFYKRQLSVILVGVNKACMVVLSLLCHDVFGAYISIKSWNGKWCGYCCINTFLPNFLIRFDTCVCIPVSFRLLGEGSV